MPYRHLLVPTDGSELSAKAVAQAGALARALGARLTLFHVQTAFPISLVGVGELVDPATVDALIEAARSHSQQVLHEAREHLAGQGLVADILCEENPLPHQAIVAAAERLGCDLVVMASHGRRGLQGVLLGSETQRVLSQCSVPVLVVR
jgi:nucleotide-binding universal stress UspA family protein